MMATKLSSALVAPSKAANILDWRKAIGSVMALDITPKSIGIAIAEHPENICESFALRPISIGQDRQGSSTTKKNQLSNELISELEAAVRQHRVCAFVVNWPVHEGRMGQECGKVLSVLDSVIDQSNSIVTRKRPFTLWCNDASASYDSSPLPDEWGRSTSFARAPTYFEGMNYSSKSATRADDESSSANSSEVAASVLDEWVKNHWEIDTKMGRATAPKKQTHGDFFFSTHSVDEYNSDKTCLQSALL